MPGADSLYLALWVVCLSPSFVNALDNYFISPALEENVSQERSARLRPTARDRSQQGTIETPPKDGASLSIQHHASSTTRPTTDTPAIATSQVPRYMPINRVRQAHGPPDPAAGGISSSVSASVSSSVFTSVSVSVSSLEASSLTAALKALSSSSSSDVQIASSQGSFIARASAQQAISSANSRADAASSSISSLLAVITTANIISSIESSANSVISAAQSSAQSAIDAARASASAASGPSSGVNLNVGQFVGIIVASLIAASLLSIFATVLVFRYRRKKALVSPKQPSPPATSAEPHNPLASPTYNVSVTTGRREAPQMRTEPNTLAVPQPFSTAPLSSRSPNDQSAPISPLSERSVDRTSAFGRHLYSTRGKETTTETGECSPMKFSLTKRVGDDGQQRMHIERFGDHDPNLHHLLSRARGRQDATEPGPLDTTVSQSEPSSSDPSSGLLVPPIPARYSSLDSFQSPLALHPVQYLAAQLNNFPLMSEDTHAEYEPAQARTSPPRNLTAQQRPRLPVSRFSVTPHPPPSVSDESDVGATSYAASPEQYTVHEADFPREVQSRPSPIRPPPPSPSQLQSPIPRRPHHAASLASLTADPPPLPRTPRTPRTPKGVSFSLFPRTPPR